MVFSDERAAPLQRRKTHFCDRNHSASATTALNFHLTGGQVVEVAMTMNFLPSRNRSGQTELSDSRAEGLRAHAAECRELANRCWHEESKQRYEELARQWLALAEQRQRSA
jgi:hypothetical protein